MGLSLLHTGDIANGRAHLDRAITGFWVANLVAFNGEMMRELAVQFLALEDKQRATASLMIPYGDSSPMTETVIDDATSVIDDAGTRRAQMRDAQARLRSQGRAPPST
jgi:hypothetical protein